MRGFEYEKKSFNNGGMCDGFGGFCRNAVS